MKIFYIILLFLTFLINNLANANNTIDTNIEKFIKDMGTISQQILDNNKLNEEQKEIKYKKFAETIIDTKWVARFILGNYWREMTPSQQKEFQNLYKDYLLENYMPKLKNYNTGLIIKKIEKQKEKVYIVFTTTKDNNNREINVNFRIIEKNNKLFITDIIPEGISFIGSQRTDINSSIAQQGYDKFIEELKNKIKK